MKNIFDMFKKHSVQFISDLSAVIKPPLSNIYHLYGSYHERSKPLSHNKEEFIRINNPIWRSIIGSKEKGYVLVAGFVEYAINYLYQGRVAKSIEEETGCVPIVLLSRFKFLSLNIIKIYNSFNINSFIFYERYSLNLFLKLKAIYNTKKLLKSNINGDELIKLKYKDVEIGDMIYDWILRTQNNVYTIDKVKREHFAHIYEGFYRTLVYERIFRKYKIKYLYIHHKSYIMHGVLARVANKYKAIVIVGDKNFVRNFEDINIKDSYTTPRFCDINMLEKDKETIIPLVDNYLDKRFSGISTVNVDKNEVKEAYGKGKRQYDRIVLFEKIGKKVNNNPIVFIMLHAFSDDAHNYNFKGMIFKDYYDWFIKTLKYVRTIENINWFFKPHPLSNFYGEGNIAKNKICEIGSQNIYIVPDDLNTKSLINIAHSIVTSRGTAGLELSCMGIPTILSATCNYSGFGFTYEPKTIEEYFNLLVNISNIQKLTKSQTEKAKILLYWIHFYLKLEDELTNGVEEIPGDSNDEPLFRAINKKLINYNYDNDQVFTKIKESIRK